MKRLILLAVSFVAWAIAPVATQSPAPSTVPELSFESVPNPLAFPPDVHLGEVAGVAVNSKGNILVFSRGNSTGPAYMAAAAQLLEFDKNGKFIREIG